MRVLLADDHPVVRAGLKAVLASHADIEVVATEPDGESALERIRALKPDVAVLDISMPGLSGIEVARRLNDEESSTALVMLSLHKTELDVQAAIEAGVCGYVVKDAAAEELVEAIRSAARGNVWISPSVSGAMVNAMRRGPTATAPITAREREEASGPRRTRCCTRATGASARGGAVVFRSCSPGDVDGSSCPWTP